MGLHKPAYLMIIGRFTVSPGKFQLSFGIRHSHGLKIWVKFCALNSLHKVTGDLETFGTGSWQDWLFVVGYLSLLLFVVGMVLQRSRR